jgi:DNA-binding transcriptional regulator YiaG
MNYCHAEYSRHYSSNNTVFTTLTGKSDQIHQRYGNTTSEKRVSAKILPFIVAFALSSSNAFASINTEVSTAKNGYSVNCNSIEDSGLISEVFALERKLSLSIASLAALLDVERKTIYNWKKNPNCKLNEKNAKRISVLLKFFDTLDEGHSKVIAKFLFKKGAIKEFSEAILRKNIDLGELTSLYDEYWIKIEGAYKRSLIV